MTEHSVESSVYTLKLDGPGINLNREISEDTLKKVMGVLFTPQEPPSHRSSEFTQDDPMIVQDEMTLREFINDVEPSTNSKMISTIAYYLTEHEGKSHFRKEDIRERFAEAKEQMPANFDRDLGVAIKQGWVTEDRNNPKSFYVTRTGIKAVKDRFLSKKDKKG